MASLDFEKVDRWIIVYDTSKDRTYTHQFSGHPKILELEYNKVGAAGHPQRNFGLEHVSGGFVYFVDDDNIVYPNFWNILDKFDPDCWYSFDQLRDIKTGQVLPGSNIAVNHIDTAMFVVPRHLIGELRWIEDLYSADAHFIIAVANRHPNAGRYIKEIGCFYNSLR